MDYLIRDNKVVFENGVILPFLDNIISSFRYDEVLIVVIHSQHLDMLQNVYGIDLVNSKVIWQIESNPAIKYSFTTVYLNEAAQDKICLTGSPGVEFNPYNGRIIEVHPWLK